MATAAATGEVDASVIDGATGQQGDDAFTMAQVANIPLIVTSVKMHDRKKRGPDGTEVNDPFLVAHGIPVEDPENELDFYVNGRLVGPLNVFFENNPKARARGVFMKDPEIAGNKMRGWQFLTEQQASQAAGGALDAILKK